MSRHVQEIFLKVMLPLILKVNEEILAERRRLEHLDQVIASGARLPHRGLA